MPFPPEPTYFEPQEQTHFYAAQGALFLVDPARVVELFPSAQGTDLIRTLTRKSYPHDLYRQGAIVPALGVEPAHYTVSVRSTQTDNAPLPLSHMLFSAGFVLGTETGDLLLCNTDRLQHWTPGTLPSGHEEHPLANLERPIHVSPGWYSVTVVVGVLDDEDGSDEASFCAFLLDPQPARPSFTADLGKPFSF